MFQKGWQNIRSRIPVYITPAVLAVLMVALFAAILLFVSPIHGLGDNGDYFFTLDANGLYIQNPETYTYGDYFQHQYGIRQYFNETDTSYFSSSRLFIALATALNRLFFSQTVFDIRFLSAVYLISFLPAIYLLTRGLTAGMSKKRAYAAALIIAFIMGDSSYTIYFNSFYPEAVAFIAVTYLFGIIFYFFRVKDQPFWFSLSFLIAVLFFLSAYRQYYSLIIVIICMGIGLLFYTITAIQRLTLLTILTGLLGLAITLGFIVPNVTYQRDVYHSLNQGVLLYADDAEAVLEEGGISSQYGLLKGSTYYEEYAPLSLHSKEIQEGFIGSTGYFWVLQAYLKNPEAVTPMLKTGVKDLYLVKPNELGNYLQKDAAEPAEKTNFFSLYNRIKAAIFPKSFGFFLLLAAALLFVYGIGFYRGIKNNERWLALRFFIILGLFLMFFSTFFLAITLAGDADYAHHLFLSSVSLDLLTILFAIDLLDGRLWSDARRELL